MSKLGLAIAITADAFKTELIREVSRTFYIVCS